MPPKKGKKEDEVDPDKIRITVHLPPKPFEPAEGEEMPDPVPDPEPVDFTMDFDKGVDVLALKEEIFAREENLPIHCQYITYQVGEPASPEEEPTIMELNDDNIALDEVFTTQIVSVKCEYVFRELPLLPCPQGDLSDRHVQKLYDITNPAEGIRLLAEFLEITDAATDSRSSIKLDYNYFTIHFSKENGLTSEQGAALFKVLFDLHSKSVGNNLTVEESYDLYKQLIVPLATQTDAEYNKLFTVEDVKLITDFVTQGFFQHYRLYLYVFNNEQEGERHSVSKLIQTTAMPADLAIGEVLSIEVYKPEGAEDEEVAADGEEAAVGDEAAVEATADGGTASRPETAATKETAKADGGEAKEETLELQAEQGGEEAEAEPKLVIDYRPGEPLSLDRVQDVVGSIVKHRLGIIQKDMKDTENQLLERIDALETIIDPKKKGK